MKKIFKQSTKGITLIALVITIIVLLILAGVSVITLTGENGILTRTTNVSKTNVHAAVVDAIALAYNEYQVDINLANTTKIASTNPIKLADTATITKETTFLEYLEIKGYADSSGILNVKNLVGSEQAYGKGTDSTDVYKIEEKSNKYIVTYYDENSSETEIWTVAISNDDYIENNKTALEEQQVIIKGYEGDIDSISNNEVYGFTVEIYSDDECSNLVNTVTLDEEKAINLVPGIYYLKIVSVPAGYIIDPNIIQKEVASTGNNVWNIVLRKGVELPSTGQLNDRSFIELCSLF